MSFWVRNKVNRIFAKEKPASKLGEFCCSNTLLKDSEKLKLYLHSLF